MDNNKYNFFLYVVFSNFVCILFMLEKSADHISYEQNMQQTIYVISLEKSEMVANVEYYYRKLILRIRTFWES